MAATTVPTPSVEIPRSLGDTSRSRKVRYVVSDDGSKRHEVQILISHSKDRKRFTASVHNVSVDTSGRFTTEGYWPFDGVFLASEPVARFSKKGLDTFTARVVAAFPEVVAVNEKVQAFFASPPAGF